MTKIICITGATAGFGAACARKFAAGGWRLVLTGRRRERLEALRAELSGVAVHLAVFDVRDKAACERELNALPQGFGDIDVLVNNAGLALGLEPAWECSLDDWETMVDTNIKGLLHMTRLILPGMAARGRGHVVNLGSIAGDYPYPGGNVYGATKAFVKQFSRNLRADLHGKGVRVTNIEPGMAESEFSLVRFKGDAPKAGKVYDNCQPLTPEDIAECIWWVCTLPAHMNINRLEIMPTCQSFGALPVARG